jgi:hypothetical protein
MPLVIIGNNETARTSLGNSIGMLSCLGQQEAVCINDLSHFPRQTGPNLSHDEQYAAACAIPVCLPQLTQTFFRPIKSSKSNGWISACEKKSDIGSGGE